MTELFEHAVELVRVLSSETQDALARMLLRLAGDDQSVVELTSEEGASFAESLAQADRRASPPTMRYAPCGRSMACEAPLYPPRRG